MSVIKSGYGAYEGTFFDVKRTFSLKHKGLPIFERYFRGNSTGIVSTTDDTIYIPNHFFVTGEEVFYSYAGSGTGNAIGIGTTSISGIGITDRLPSTLYIVKKNDIYVQVAASSSDALKTIPKVLDITNVGFGTLHRFISKKQNTRALISIDNVIQSPIVSTSITSKTSAPVLMSDNTIDFVGITSFFGGDLIKIDDEIMRITSVGSGAFPNRIVVQRAWMGTGITTHNSGQLITKIVGDYNIVDNNLSFVSAPYGPSPIGTITNPPSQRDYSGITTHSTFSGRIFIRSGLPDTEKQPYDYNYVFDDISSGFAGLTTEFTLKSNLTNITGFSTGNAIILINDIFQGPSRFGPFNVKGEYSLKEVSGITSISFSGIGSAFSTYDINVRNAPRGGLIISVGSTSGFGYQPLVSAGGTAIVSVAGTISAISIGNSGSGYRAGIQTNVRVGVTTVGISTVDVKFIGTATINNGHIVSVAITNPGFGYTSTNPPLVVFDEPLSYSNLPLIYSSSSISGIGTKATIDIVVGQGSSVINFEIRNTGYEYGQGEILTVETGGSVGIPTNPLLPFKEFQITVDRTFTDKFTGWTFGDLQVFDPIDNLFDGRRVNFPLKIDNQRIGVNAKKGSNIDVQATLIIFLNDVLQVPGMGYRFKGGSILTFSEPPKPGDRCKILFYKGTSEVDVVEVDILETIKVGDSVTINSESESLQQTERLVTDIISTNDINTNVYAGPGITLNQTLSRPILWCKQTEDRFINNTEVTKDRTLYEAYIQPTTNLIQNVGIDSTFLFVESVKTFFDPVKEFNSKNSRIIISSQDNLVAASATAVVSAAGTISSIVISDGGVGYTTNPIISISSPIGFGISLPRKSYVAGDVVPVGLGTIAEFTSTISVGGALSSVTITNPGSGYTSSNPPVVSIEPPAPHTEIITNVIYDGDFGVITGVKTTSVGVASTGIVFDLYIPNNSYLRDANIVGTAITISGIQTGYYFVAYNTNVGNGVTTLNSDGTIVGLGSTFLDNIYHVSSVSIAQTSVPGVGTTYVAQVVVSLSSYNNLSGIGISGFYGEYSWGRISGLTRRNPRIFTIYNNGITGISTSPIVRRYSPLKYQNYLT